MAQPDSHVELAGAHRVPDRAAPQHAGVTGVGIEVGERAERPGGRHHRVLVPVVEVGQRHRRGAHQRAVAGGAPAALMQSGRFGAGPRCRDAVTSGRGEHRTGLDTDILRTGNPAAPACDDGVLRRLITQIRTGGGDLGDGDRHRGVIGPLAGLPTAAADHGDLECGAAGRLKLIRCT